MKLSPDLATFPIIICSAAFQALREQEGSLATQGVMIVLKPFSIAVVLAAIHAVLDDAPPES